MTNRVLRYEIPVDDQPHPIPDGLPLMLHRWRQAGSVEVAGRVELWVEVEIPDDWPRTGLHHNRLAQVIGTGHEIPEGASWMVSCLDGPLMWHLYDVTEAKIDG